MLPCYSPVNSLFGLRQKHQQVQELSAKRSIPPLPPPKQTNFPCKFPCSPEKGVSAPLNKGTGGVTLLSLQYDYGMMTMLISFPCHWRSIRVKTKTMPAGLFK